MAAEEVARLTTLAVTVDPKALADFETTTVSPSPNPNPNPNPNRSLYPNPNHHGCGPRTRTLS